LNFSEAFQTKQVAILNTETLDVRYVKNTFSPKHLIIPAEQIDLYDLNNNFVIVQVDSMSSADLMDMRKTIQDKYETIQSLEFREIRSWESKINHVELQKKFDLAKGDIFERYMQTIGIGNLEKMLLLEIVKEICHGE